MVPAQQRLDAGDLAGRHIDLRLIVQRELVALQRAAQRGLQRQALDRLRLDLLGEEAEAVLAVFLGEVHRHVGVLGQRLHVGAVGRDTSRCRSRPWCGTRGRSAASGWLSTDSSSPAMRSTSWRSAASSRMTTNSSPPSRATTSLDAQRAAQPAADLHQQHVAGVVPQRIVDDLEPVEIDEQQRKLPLVARARPRSRGEACSLNISRFGRSVRLSCDARYSIRSSALVFSSARSKFSSANDTLSASRCSSSANSGVNVSFSQRHENHDADGLAAAPAAERRRRTGRHRCATHGVEMRRRADRPDNR